MTDFNMHRLKREAHKEAWYGQSSNPFRRVWVDREVYIIQDIENQSDLQALRTTPSELPPGRKPQAESIPQWSSNDAISDNALAPDMISNSINSEKPEMSGAQKYEQSSEETVVEPRPIDQPPNKEQSIRQRIITEFSRGRKTAVCDKADSVGVTSRSPTEKKSSKHKPFTVGNQLKATIFNSWINLLLIAAPIGIVTHFINVSPVAAFVTNFIAIIPLAALLSYATEEIALRIGETFGGLLNATFGNAVELIVSIVALAHNEVVIVKTSLIGSMLSNLLLVMGMSFFFGGLRRTEQFFNKTVATTAASMLALAIAGVIIPTAFQQFTSTTNVPIAEISRGTAVMLLLIYGCYLYFQLKTHSAIFAKEGKKVAMRPRKHSIPEGGVVKALAAAGAIGAAQGRIRGLSVDRLQHDELLQRDAYEKQAAADKEADEPRLHLWVAVFTLAASTTLVALCAEFMIDGISSIVSGDSGISVEFVGLILVPIVGNAAEHATAVTVACKDKMDLAIGVAVGSSMQIALLVFPFSVILGWILGNDAMNLSLEPFLVVVLFVSVLLVNYTCVDGKSNWLEGALLQTLYLIIAVSAWFYPHTSD